MTLFVCSVFEATYIKFEYVSLKLKRVPFFGEGTRVKRSLGAVQCKPALPLLLHDPADAMILEESGQIGRLYRASDKHQ